MADGNRVLVVTKQLKENLCCRVGGRHCAFRGDKYVVVGGGRALVDEKKNSGGICVVFKVGAVLWWQITVTFILI